MSSSGAAGSATVGALAGLQNGVLLSTDLALSAISINAGTGALSFTVAATTQFAFVKQASGTLTAVTVGGGAQTPAALTPATPNYAVIGVEISTAGAVALVKGTDTATQLNTGSLIASNSPAVTSGKLRIADFAIQNNAGAFRFGDQTTVASKGVNWIDRRPQARGFQYAPGPIIGADFTTTSTTTVPISTTSLQFRAECTGVPLNVRLSGLCFASVSTFIDFFLNVDGTQLAGAKFEASSGGNGVGASLVDVTFVPAAGSHLLTFNWLTGAGTATIRSSAGSNAGPVVIIDELLGANFNSGTA